MQPGNAAFLDDVEASPEHRLGFGRESRDQVGAEDDVGPGGTRATAEFDRLAVPVAALHALQNHVVARLQRQVQMRPPALLPGDQANPPVVELAPATDRTSAG